MNDISINLQLISDALPELIQEALEKSAQQIENTAKQNCLVDTGTLRRSIMHDVTETKATIGTNIEYAPIVHEKFKPFLQEAFNENMQNVQNNFEGLLEKGVE